MWNTPQGSLKRTCPERNDWYHRRYSELERRPSSSSNADILHALDILTQRVDDGEKRFDDLVDEIEGVEDLIADTRADFNRDLGFHAGRHAE